MTEDGNVVQKTIFVVKPIYVAVKKRKPTKL